MLIQALTPFTHFANTSRVWIYQADRMLEIDEIQFIEANLGNFTNSWEAHGKSLKAKGRVLFNRFLVLMVDESVATATGCSIDKSVHFVQQIGKTLSLDWFNRLNVVFLDNNKQLQTFDFRKVDEGFTNGQLTADTIIFNNNVHSKADLIENWLMPIKSSYLARQMKMV